MTRSAARQVGRARRARTTSRTTPAGLRQGRTDRGTRPGRQSSRGGVQAPVQVVRLRWPRRQSPAREPCGAARGGRGADLQVGARNRETGGVSSARCSRSDRQGTGPRSPEGGASSGPQLAGTAMAAKLADLGAAGAECVREVRKGRHAVVGATGSRVGLARRSRTGSGGLCVASGRLDRHVLPGSGGRQAPDESASDGRLKTGRRHYTVLARKSSWHRRDAKVISSARQCGGNNTSDSETARPLSNRGGSWWRTPLLVPDRPLLIVLTPRSRRVLYAVRRQTEAFKLQEVRRGRRSYSPGSSGRVWAAFGPECARDRERGVRGQHG